MPSDLGYARVPNGSGPMQYQDHTFDANNQPVSANSNVVTKPIFRVYPNFFYIIILFFWSTQDIGIFNIMGQNVFSGNDIKSVDISNWESGIYFVHSEDLVVKIIKQ